MKDPVPPPGHRVFRILAALIKQQGLQTTPLFKRPIFFTYLTVIVTARLPCFSIQYKYLHPTCPEPASQHTESFHLSCREFSACYLCISDR